MTDGGNIKDTPPLFPCLFDQRILYFCAKSVSWEKFINFKSPHDSEKCRNMNSPLLSLFCLFCDSILQRKTIYG